MNWIGGARNRARRGNTEEKKQKEFFERRKLANISKTAVPVSTSLKKSEGVSWDILRLQCVKETKRSASPSELSRVSHISPDQKSCRMIAGRPRQRDDLFGGKVRRAINKCREPKNHRQRFHLPNASPCKQPSTLDLANASDAEHRESRQFRYLPSYQSTPIDEISRAKAGSRPSSSQVTSKTRGCLSQAVSMPSLTQRNQRNEVSFSRFDETMKECDFLMLPNATSDCSRNGKRVIFSNIDEYRSLSEESLSDRYSIFENFLHKPEDTSKHSLSESSDIISTNSISSNDVMNHAYRTQEHVAILGSNNLMSPKVEKTAASVEFFQGPDFTPIKGSPFWPSDFTSSQFPLSEFPNPNNTAAMAIGFHPSSYSESDSLTSWLRSKKEIGFEDKLEQPLAATPGSHKITQREDLNWNKAGRLVGENVNFGSSSEVIVSHNEDIPGLESGPNGWERIKIEQPKCHKVGDESAQVKSEGSIAFPWIINENDGLHSENDVERKEGPSKMATPEEERRSDEGIIPNRGMTARIILAEAAERLLESQKKPTGEEILPPLRDETYSVTLSASPFLGQNGSTKRFVDKACSPIQAIFPKLNAEVGVQTNPLTTSKPCKVTVETQTQDMDETTASVTVQPFVLLDERVVFENEDVTKKRSNDHSPSQSSTDESSKEDNCATKRRRSKRLKHTSQP